MPDTARYPVEQQVPRYPVRVSSYASNAPVEHDVVTVYLDSYPPPASYSQTILDDLNTLRTGVETTGVKLTTDYDAVLQATYDLLHGWLVQLGTTSGGFI